MFKRLSLIVLLLLQFFCISAKLQNAATQQSEQRKTSKPYTADLSIFDSQIGDDANFSGTVNHAPVDEREILSGCSRRKEESEDARDDDAH